MRLLGWPEGAQATTCARWALIVAPPHVPDPGTGAYIGVPGKAWLILHAERSLSCNCPFNR
jgi:hypothetical protein